VEDLDLLVLAAGSGTRVGGSVPKQFQLLGGRPVIVYGLRVFESIPYIASRLLVCAPELMSPISDMLEDHRMRDWTLVEGGRTRADSVRLGLARVRTERVVTHNAAMPFVTRHLVDQVQGDDDCITTTTPLEYNLCEGEDIAERIVPRARLKYINTPQSFRTDVVLQCHERAHLEGFVPQSDTELLLHYGHRIRLVPGTPANFKVTTRTDLLTAEMILGHPELWEELGLDSYWGRD